MKKVLKISSAIIVLALAIFLAIPSNHYIIRALIYQLPNIDDYKIFENRTIAKGDAQPWKLSENYNKYNFSPEQLDYFTKYQAVAYLVIKDTSILSETYWGGYNKDSYSNSFSMSKKTTSP